MSETEAAAGLVPITQSVDEKVVIVSDPGDDSRPKRWGELHMMGQAARCGNEAQLLKEKRYIFDRAFDGLADTQAVYNQSVRVTVSPLWPLNGPTFVFPESAVASAAPFVAWK